MNDFYKDIYIGVLFVLGMFGYMSGDYIISSALFAVAAIASNINFNRKRINARHVLCE
ncbi:MAG: hypothetical protein ABL903_02405 [Methylococcales bacterium]